VRARVRRTQVFVARRDNAKTIFKAIMEREGNELRADRCARGLPWLQSGQGRACSHALSARPVRA